MKIGFIGSSDISRFHIDALKNNKFEIEAIGTRSGSSNCMDLAKRFNFLDKFCKGGWEEVIVKEVDAFCLCIDTLETPKILKEILKVGKPVLVEKPISIYLSDFDDLIKNPMKNKIFVGYNRRFYKTLKIAKQKCDQSIDGGTVIVNIPETIASFKEFLNNGCHIIDSLRYLIGDFEIEKKISKKDKTNLNFFSIYVLCKNKKWNIAINAHKNIPANFSITIMIDDLVYELKPLEKLTIYRGMKVLEPCIEEPIRRYIPHIKECINEKAIFKPGFNEMYQNFSEFVSNKKVDFCSIYDARKTIEICGDLIS